MNQTRQKITGILLAGGKSSRMGREKGKIVIRGQYLYQYPLKVLESLCDEILISTCKDFEIEEKYQQVCDEIPNTGPIGGLYTCLKKSANELNIILSYDLPFVSNELMQMLMENMGEEDVILPSTVSGKPEPLCGIYRKRVSEVLSVQIKNNVFAVHKIFPLMRTRTVLITDSEPFFHKDLFRNINDKTDLEGLAADIR